MAIQPFAFLFKKRVKILKIAFLRDILLQILKERSSSPQKRPDGPGTGWQKVLQSSKSRKTRGFRRRMAVRPVFPESVIKQN
jgi:hypothetical protein